MQTKTTEIISLADLESATQQDPAPPWRHHLTRLDREELELLEAQELEDAARDEWTDDDEAALSQKIAADEAAGAEIWDAWEERNTNDPGPGDEWTEGDELVDYDEYETARELKEAADARLAQGVRNLGHTALGAVLAVLAYVVYLVIMGRVIL